MFIFVNVGGVLEYYVFEEVGEFGLVVYFVLGVYVVIEGDCYGWNCVVGVYYYVQFVVEVFVLDGQGGEC